MTAWATMDKDGFDQNEAEKIRQASPLLSEVL